MIEFLASRMNVLPNNVGDLKDWKKVFENHNDE